MEKSACQIAAAYNTAKRVGNKKPTQIRAIVFEGARCEFVGQSGEPCSVADLMLFPDRPICMGYSNVCQMALEAPEAYSHAMKGDRLERIRALGNRILGRNTV